MAVLPDGAAGYNGVAAGAGMACGQFVECASVGSALLHVRLGAGIANP